MSDLPIIGYFPIFKTLSGEGRQTAASFGAMWDSNCQMPNLETAKPEDVETIIAIRPALINDENNAIDKVMAAVRSTLETLVERHKKFSRPHRSE